MHHLWELACLRCRRRGLAGTPQRCHREQARSHRWGPGTPRIQLAMHHLWELACLRCRRRGLAGTPQRCHREQARSHKGSWQAANSAGHASPVGAGLPAMQTARSGRHTAALPSRASPLPQRGLASCGFSWPCITCGSWLACDADGAVWQAHCSPAIASKPAPAKGPGTPRIQLAMHHLWELACLRCRRRGLAGTPQRCHREQARSHTIFGGLS